MSTPTVTELKNYVLARYIENSFLDTGLKEILDYYAESMNAKRQGYRCIRTIVRAEQFSSTESILIQDNSSKFTELESVDMSVLTVARVSHGKYRVTTGYDDVNSENLRDNGIVSVQCFHDLPSYDTFKSGSSNFPADNIGLSTVVDFVSPGVFDIYISDNGTLKDSNFYLNIELFNMPTV